MHCPATGWVSRRAITIVVGVPLPVRRLANARATIATSSRHPAYAVILAAAAAVLFPARAASQSLGRELRVDPCPGCRLTKRVVAVLGRSNDSVLVMPRSRVVRLGATRYLAGPVSVPGQLAIYRSDGTLERVVGRQGGGPMEFSRNIGLIIESTSGTAIVVDRQNARLTLVDSLGNGRFYASRAGSVFSGASLPDGRLVISAQYRTPERFGFPLHVVDRGGRIVRSFGEMTRTVSPSTGVQVRIVARARGGGVWFSPNDKYELTLADSLGRIAMVLTRPFAAAPPGPSGTLAFFISSIHEDMSGHIWVVSGLRRNAPELRKEAPINAGAMQALAAGLTSTIDIIDPKRGAVVYSEAIDGPPTPIIADGLAYRYREDADGNPRIELVSLQLTRPN